MSHEGVPQEEVLQESGEAFVPENKQEEFENFVDTAEQQRQEQQDLELQAEFKRDHSKQHLATGGTLAVAGTLGALGGPLIPGVGLVAPAIGIPAALTGAGLMRKGFQERQEAKSDERHAGYAEKKADEAYSDSRRIVTDELRMGGATYDAFKQNPNGSPLEVTPEQIEIARKEMEDKMGS